MVVIGSRVYRGPTLRVLTSASASATALRVRGLWANFKMERGLVVRGPSCRHQLSPITDDLVTGRVLLGFS
jgi:hypothetical protein